MHSFVIHPSDARSRPTSRPSTNPSTMDESRIVVGKQSRDQQSIPHLAHTRQKKKIQIHRRFKAADFCFGLNRRAPSWDVIDGLRTANHRGTRPLSFLSKKKRRREKKNEIDIGRSRPPYPFFAGRKRSKNARTTSSSSSRSRDSTTLGRARGRPLPGRPLDDAPPERPPRLDDVGLSLSRISCGVRRFARCDASRLRPPKRRRRGGIAIAVARSARRSGQSVCFRFHAFISRTRRIRNR